MADTETVQDAFLQSIYENLLHKRTAQNSQTVQGTVSAKRRSLTELALRLSDSTMT